MTNQQDYDQAVIAVARGETVPNLTEIIAHSRFCRDAFDSHVRQERQRIEAENNPPPPLGAVGRERAEYWQQIADQTKQGEKPE